MTEGSRYKDEFNKTGHSYGYFVSKPSLKKGTKADITCVIPLLKSEYEIQLGEIESIMSASAFADIITDFNDIFAAVVASMETIDSKDLQVVKKAQRILESYAEAIVRTVTHFENKIKATMGEAEAKNFSQQVSAIYDQGDSYSLFYKLRNVYQHEGNLPLKLNRSINQNGLSESKLILDSSKLLNEHTSNYLNEKVKKFLSTSPDVDIYLHAVIVYEQLSNLFDSFIRNVLLNEERALSCAHQIEQFTSLEEPVSVLLLTDLYKETDGESDVMNMTQTHVPLEYLCKLLSSYLKGRPGLLFSYWGQPLNEDIRRYLPGAYNLIGPEYFNDTRIVDIQGIKYSWLKKTLSFGGSSIEMTSMFYEIRGQELSKEQADTYWTLYGALAKALKILDKLLTDASQRNLAES